MADQMVDAIITHFHPAIPLTRRDLWAALRETAHDLDERAALLEARQIIGALLDTRTHG